jgi:hypothetical protein
MRSADDDDDVDDDVDDVDDDDDDEDDDDEDNADRDDEPDASASDPPAASAVLPSSSSTSTANFGGSCPRTFLRINCGQEPTKNRRHQRATNTHVKQMSSKHFACFWMGVPVRHQHWPAAAHHIGEKLCETTIFGRTFWHLTTATTNGWGHQHNINQLAKSVTTHNDRPQRRQRHSHT